MSQNKLKLNADKTEVLVLGTPKQRAKISVPSISVNGEIVKILNIPIGNLGSVFDPSMNMAAHVSKGSQIWETITFETSEGSENT